MSNNKKQFSLTLLIRVLLATLVVVSIGVFANSVMRYNALLEETEALKQENVKLVEEKEEMQEMLQALMNPEENPDYVVKIAKELWGLYFPDEEIIKPK